MTAANAHAEGVEPLDITREAVHQEICPEPDHGMCLLLVNIDGSYIVRRLNPSSSCVILSNSSFHLFCRAIGIFCAACITGFTFMIGCSQGKRPLPVKTSL